MAVSDAAAFQQFLSTFALHLQRLDASMKTELSIPTMALHVKSLESVRARILSPGLAMDDGLLITIMSFVAHYVCIDLCPTSHWEELTGVASSREVRYVANSHVGAQENHSFTGRDSQSSFEQARVVDDAVFVWLNIKSSHSMLTS